MDHSVLHLARYASEAVPAALAEWHRGHGPGAQVRVHGQWRGSVPFDAVVEGAGTSIVGATAGLGQARWTLRRDATLADLVAPRLHAIVVGLNPSVAAAEAGVPFAGATNRFWPAAVEAGLVPIDRDPWAAFRAGVGFTDLVKRASPRADELSPDDFIHGAQRVRGVIEWLAPRVVCFAGVTGYRAAFDRKAEPGLQRDRIGNSLVYMMGNPSGANAHATTADLVADFRRVRELVDTH